MNNIKKVKMLTISKINKHISCLGYELTRGKGYYYFFPISDNVPMLTSDSVYVYRLNHLTLNQWLNELNDKIKEAKEVL